MSELDNRDALRTAPWMSGLTETLQSRALQETSIHALPARAFVCRKGEAVTHWIGVLTGLVKVSSVSKEGKPISFIGVPAGGWFGEGSLLKREPRRYDAITL